MTLFRTCALGAALLATGCATTFRPLEASGRAPSNMAAAEYSLADQTRHIGAAQVWFDSPADDDSQLLRLGLRIRNEGASPVRLDLDDTELEVRTQDGRLLVIPEIQAILGDTVIPPRTTGRMELAFLLPGETTMGDLVGFELLWAVVSEDGARVTQSTTFVPETWAQAQERRRYR